MLTDELGILCALSNVVGHNADVSEIQSSLKTGVSQHTFKSQGDIPHVNLIPEELPSALLHIHR